MKAGFVLALLLASQLANARIDVDAARPGQRPPAGSDEDALWYAMERAERELQDSPQRIQDPALEAYVRGIACKVAPAYCSDLRVYLLERPWFNASMAPNGMLVVWSGALLRLRDEAELALLLGHEFAHFRERHSLQHWRKAKRTTAFMATFGLATYGGGVGAAAPLAGIAGAASLMQLSRESEREADRIGFELATAHGYDPEAGIRLWQRVHDEEATRKRGRPLPVFASHPDSAARLADVRDAAQAHPRADTQRGIDAYRQAIAPFLGRWLEGELSRRNFDASVAVITRLRDDFGAVHRGLTTFFLAEAYRRRGEPQDLAIAADLYHASTRLPEPPAAAYREWAQVLQARGDAPAATQAFRRYLELAPDAEDAAFIHHYLQALEPAR